MESFLDFLCDGGSAGEVSDGDGAGDGKNGLQDGNGLPQSCKFPEKEDAGNLARTGGIEPFRLLLETLKSVKFDGFKLGKLPAKRLFCKNSLVKWFKLLIENGIEPVKLFDERSRRDTRVNRVKLGGKSPVNTLFWRYRLRRRVKLEKSEGISPERRFERRLRTRS